MRQLAWMLLAGLLVVTSGSLAAQQASPDMILNNGKIITVDDRFSIAQAIAIRGDRIVAADARVMGADGVGGEGQPAESVVRIAAGGGAESPKADGVVATSAGQGTEGADSPTNVLALPNL
jgi:hypothetical protein